MGGNVSRRESGLSSVRSSSSIDATLKDYNLGRPSAAVIGAGIAGVHVAYELAQQGFDVTVFDQNTSVACGETKDSLPFVGVGLIEPSLLRMSLRRELVKGMISSLYCPDVIGRDHWFNSLLSPTVYRWMVGRVRSVFTEKEAMWYTNNLSRLSVAVVADLSKRYPALRRCISELPLEVQVRSAEESRASQRSHGGTQRDSHSGGSAGMALAETRGAQSGVRHHSPQQKSRGWVRAPTAHETPIAIHPVEWTRTLAEISKEKFGVQFELGSRVESSNNYLKYDVEATRSLQISKPDPASSGARIVEHRSFDVVVLTAGASTGVLTRDTTRIPIVGLSGWAATFTAPSAAIQAALKDVLPFQRVLCDAAAELSNPCSLYAYTLPAEPPLDAAKAGGVALAKDSIQRFRISGLLSLDTTQSTRHGTPAWAKEQLARMQSYLSVKCGLHVPLTDVPIAEEGRLMSDCSNTRGEVELREYVRAFTPDGVPIIDHNGAAFNVFVCSGFGDHAADFAPGSARILGRLVTQQAELLLEQDRAELAKRGMVAAVATLPPSRLHEVQQDLNKLYTGVLLESDSAVSGGQSGRETFWRRFIRRSSPSILNKDHTEDTARHNRTSSVMAAATTAPVLDTEDVRVVKYEGNPYSTNRFSGMVSKQCRDVTHKSLIYRFSNLETLWTRSTEPYERRLRDYMINVAESEGCSERWREALLFLFDDRPDTGSVTFVVPPTVNEKQQLVERYEMPMSGTGTRAASNMEAIERSKMHEKEAARRARELFSSIK